MREMLIAYLVILAALALALVWLLATHSGELRALVGRIA